MSESLRLSVPTQLRSTPPTVGIVMGSDSDLPVMQQAAEILQRLGVEYELRVVSAHRTPADMAEYGLSAADRGLKIIIAGAGGAAHLPGMLAAYSTLPVIGVPINVTSLNGMDSLLSIVQMPSGVPVATVAINGGTNAGLLAAQMLAISQEELRKKLIVYKQEMKLASREKNERIQPTA